MRNYVQISKEELADLIEAGYNYPEIYIDGNGDCFVKDVIFDMYESHCLSMCEI